MDQPIETAAVAPVTETPVEQKAPEVDPRIAQMAKREKILVRRSREIAQREQAIAAKEAALEAIKSQQAPQRDWVSDLKTNPLKTLEDAGMSYDELVSHLVNQNPQDHHIAKLAQQLEEIRNENKAVKEQLEKQQTDQRAQALKQMGVEIGRMVRDNPEEFETILAAGKEAEQAVVDLIDKTFDEEGYVMDLEEAAKDVEEYLVERALSLAKLKKIQSKLSPSQEAATQELPIPQNATSGTRVIPRDTPKTLTHAMTSQSKPMTAKERRERAILAFQGKLQV